MTQKYYLYELLNTKSGTSYIGITNNIKRRLSSHKCAAKRGAKSVLYDAIRSYGFNNFILSRMKIYDSVESAQLAEFREIDIRRNLGIKIYNLADGGNKGYSIPIERRSEWIEKLTRSRVGRTPSLGMKHTDENKKFFSYCSKKRWSGVNLYPIDEIKNMSLQEAKAKFGISQTHYYRLRRGSRVDYTKKYD